jgi:glycosyltransferase involved in cell wall biosynthesis
MRPTITAIIPVFNGRRCLRVAIDSILAQTTRPDELIVVDDGSTDGSREVLEGLETPFRLRVIVQANQGQSAARNTAARQASGELLAFLDQDDQWLPRHLEVLGAVFARDPEIGWCYSDFDEIDGHGYVVTRAFLREYRVRHPKATVLACVNQDLMVLPSASVLRRSMFDQVGGFDEALCGYEDDDLFVRCFRAGWGHRFVAEPLARFRIHGTSSSATPRFIASRLRYADKLESMFEAADRLDRHYIRDAVAPRFFNTTLDDFVRACSANDWTQARDASVALEHFATLRGRGTFTAWKLALTRHPRLFRALMAMNEGLPQFLRWRAHPAVRLRRRPISGKKSHKRANGRHAPAPVPPVPANASDS